MHHSTSICCMVFDVQGRCEFSVAYLSGSGGASNKINNTKGRNLTLKSAYLSQQLLSHKIFTLFTIHSENDWTIQCANVAQGLISFPNNEIFGCNFFSPSYVEPVFSFTLFAFLNSETGREQKSPKYSNHAKTHVTIQYPIMWHVVLQLKKQFWQCRVQSRACGLFLHLKAQKALHKKKKKLQGKKQPNNICTDSELC